MRSSKALQFRLQNAYQCCQQCGEQYGTPRAGTSTCWRGVCDVCGLEVAVTETRDWGYLQRGLAEMGVPSRY